jgi:hypothetical protein
LGLSYQGVKAFERKPLIARELDSLKQEIAKRNHQDRMSRCPWTYLKPGFWVVRAGAARIFNLVPESYSWTVDRRVNP